MFPSFDAVEIILFKVVFFWSSAFFNDSIPSIFPKNLCPIRHSIKVRSIEVIRYPECCSTYIFHFGWAVLISFRLFWDARFLNAQKSCCQRLENGKLASKRKKQKKKSIQSVTQTVKETSLGIYHRLPFINNITLTTPWAWVFMPLRWKWGKSPILQCTTKKQHERFLSGCHIDFFMAAIFIESLLLNLFFLAIY